MKRIALLILLLGGPPVRAQDVEVAHGLHVSLSFPAQLRVVVSYNVHVRSHLAVASDVALTPLADLKVSLFSNHLGSSRLKTYRAPIYVNATLSYGGLLSIDERTSETYVPVFTTTYANVLNNAYSYNAGFAISQTLQFTPVPKPTSQRLNFRQRVGNLMVATPGFYLTYYNDGGPLLKHFGDKLDRYWTGGITLGLRLGKDDKPHHVELAFDKFTGWTQHAYEVAGLLMIDNVPYEPIEQLGYNTGRLGLRYFNHDLALGGHLNWWNIRFDLQDWIHRDISRDPYHPKVERQHVDVEALKSF